MKSNLCPSQRPTVDSMFTLTAQVAQTCATAGNGEQMGAKDNGGRRRAGADYLQQGPAKRAEEVAIGLLGDASARLRCGPPSWGALPDFLGSRKSKAPNDAKP